MINSGRNILLVLVGVVVVAFGCGDKQSQTQSSPPSQSSQPAPTPTSAPAATSPPLFWAEVLEQNPDPKVVTDADFLKRITETKLPWRVKDKATGIEMLLVPPGKFVMGMSPGDKEAVEVEKLLAEKLPQYKYSERPAHEVTITKAFYLGRTEVTQGQWMKVMGENPSGFQDGSREKLITKYIDDGLTKQEAQERAIKETPNGWEQEKNPVENISWDDCRKFCEITRM